jgi:uncharacterized protein (UPF0332 family)/predicted nucleotidyltransferase
MATLEQASLTIAERQALERSLERLLAELGEDLLAVWLYGSRARGESPGEDSDIDLLVVVSDRERLDRRASRAVSDAVDAQGANSFTFSTQVTDPRHLAEDAAIESLYLREVEHDRIVLWGGENTPLAPLEEHELPPRVGPGGVLTRSLRWLDMARGYLKTAEDMLEHEMHSSPLASTAYYAAFYAGRAALSEEGRVARKHDGHWHLMRELFVETGRLDVELVGRAQALQEEREGADYEGWTFVPERSVAQVDVARAFLAAVEQLIGAEPPG